MQETKIYELMGSSFAIQVKNSIRMGPKLAEDFYNMIKHLDRMFIYSLIPEDCYSRVFLTSLSEITKRTSTYISENLNGALGGTLTNIQAISEKDLSIQRSNIDDRDLLANLPRVEYDRLIYLFDAHIEELKKIKRVVDL